MTRTFRALVMVAAALWSAPALAQSAASGTGDDLRWYAGVHFGTGVVEHFSGVIGLDAGMRIRPGVDIVGQADWMGNVVARRQLDNIGKLATIIGAAQNGPATGSIKAPARYLGIGGRYVFEQESRLKPYVMVTLGSAQTELKPTLTLRGTDITGSVGQYGVTLGRDVIGTSRTFASALGVGILLRQGAWYGDASARLTSISGDDQRVNVAQLLIGGGYRF